MFDDSATSDDDLSPAVFAPFSAVYRRARHRENAVAPGFWRAAPGNHRQKTGETGWRTGL